MGFLKTPSTSGIPFTILPFLAPFVCPWPRFVCFSCGAASSCLRIMALKVKLGHAPPESEEAAAADGAEVSAPSAQDWGGRGKGGGPWRWDVHIDLECTPTHLHGSGEKGPGRLEVAFTTNGGFCALPCEMFIRVHLKMRRDMTDGEVPVVAPVRRPFELGASVLRRKAPKVQASV